MCERFGGPFTQSQLTAPRESGGWGLNGVDLLLREQAIADPLFLATRLLSPTWKENLFVRPSEAHLKVRDAMVAQKNLLYVDARGTGKTTLVDEVGAVWQLLKYPNDCILVLQANDQNAKAIAGQIREHFTNNRVLLRVFPEYELKRGDSNILSFSVPCRSIITREASVEIGTPGMSLAGRHYDVILASDIMNENTTPPPCGLSTIENMKALVSWYAQSDGLLQKKAVNPRAHKRIDSNRWHDGDLAGELIRKDKHNSFVKVIRGVKRGEDGRFISTWPGVIESEELHQIHQSASMNAATWAANYCSDPLPEGGMTFDRSWFKLYVDIPERLAIAITVDPAFSDGKADAKKTDRSAMVVTGLDPFRRMYVLQTKAGRWTPKEFIDHLYNLIDFWQPRGSDFWVGIEDSGGARPLETIFFNEMLQGRPLVPYRKLKVGSRSKDARMSPLHTYAQNVGIFVKAEHEELVEELVRFGVAEHDDLADAIAYRAIEMTSAGKMAVIPDEIPTSVPPTERMTGKDFITRMKARRDAKNRPYWLKGVI